MKSLKLFFAIISVIFTSLSLTAANTNNGKALIIAIGDYPKDGGWNKINAKNDVDLLRTALTAKGFQSGNIKVLQDEQAKFKNIQSALEEFIGKLGPGDLAFLHFSSHGQQIADQAKGDELDGYDEAIVAYDAHKSYKPGVYEGGNHFRDDQLATYISRIRKKIGKSGSLLVSIDACHSGTATRGMAPARGTSDRFGTANLKDHLPSVNESSMQLHEDDSELAALVCFYASAPDELNFETFTSDGQLVGSLSYAISQALQEVGTDASYQVLFDMVKAKLKNSGLRQTPMAEGDMDRAVFGGKLPKTPDHFELTNWVNNSTVEISGGELHEVFSGATIEFYKPGQSPQRMDVPVTSGKVVKTQLNKSTIKLSSTLYASDASSLWAFETAKGYVPMSISVQLDLSNEQVKQMLEQHIKQMHFVRLTDGAADILVSESSSRGATQVNVLTKYDEELARASIVGPSDAITIRNIIERYARANYLKGLKESTHDVRFELIPVNVKADGEGGYVEKGTIDLRSKQDAQGTLVMKDGDFFKIKVTNNSVSKKYVSLMDIQPDFYVNVLLPAANAYGHRNPMECYVSAGESVVFPNLFQIGPPYGQEMFKLIATDEPIQLAGVFENQGLVATRGSAKTNPLEELVAGTFSNHRGASSMSVPKSTVQVQTLLFRIDK